MIISEYRSPVNSLKELKIFLKLHDINEGENKIKEIWNNIKEPLILRKSKSRLHGHSYENNWKKLTQIVYVWQQGNTRYVLWNDKTLEICEPENPRYNYLDKGNYQYEETILLFNHMDEEIVKKIKLYWDKAVRPYLAHNFLEYYYLTESRHITLNEFNRLIEAYLNGKKTLINPKLPQKKIDEIKDVINFFNLGIKISDKFIEFDDLKFGIETKNLNEFLMITNDEIYRERYADSSRAFNCLTLLLLRAYFDEIAFIPYGEYVIWVGKFSIKYKSMIKGKKIFACIDGMQIDQKDLVYALEKAKEFADKEKYFNFLGELKKQPHYCSSFVNNGLVINAICGPGNEIIITIPVKKRGQSFYFVLPDTNEEFCVKGGFETLKNLSDHFEFCFDHEDRDGPSDVFRVYKKLSKYLHLPKEKIIILIDRAKKNMEATNKKARVLLEEALTKYKNRISAGRFRIRDREVEGFLVKGDTKNYFLSKKRLGIYSYPEGRYICVVDDEEGEKLSRIDRLVSRLYLLINDEKLKDKIKTLDEEHDMHFGGEFDETEDIE